MNSRGLIICKAECGAKAISSRFSDDQIRGKFEAALRRIESVNEENRIESIDNKCVVLINSPFSEKARSDLCDYFLEHPQFGKMIHSHTSKDDPSCHPKSLI